MQKSHVAEWFDSGACPPLTVEKGFVSPSGNIPEGVDVAIFCNKGYKVNGNRQGTCQASKSYAKPTPICAPIINEGLISRLLAALKRHSSIY